MELGMMSLATIVAMLTLAFLTDGQNHDYHPMDRYDLLKLPCDENWVAKNGNGCEKYGKNEWCRKDKKGSDYYGRKWKARWRTFEHWMDREGRTARVCPQCGCKAVPGVYELDGGSSCYYFEKGPRTSRDYKCVFNMSFYTGGHSLERRDCELKKSDLNKCWGTANGTWLYMFEKQLFGNYDSEQFSTNWHCCAFAP